MMRRALRAEPAVRSMGVFLIVLGWCGTDRAQDIRAPQARQGTRIAPILLLTRGDIQKELGMSPEQMAEARSLAAGLQQKVSALHGKSGDGIMAARRSIDDQQSQWLTKNLSPAQLDRLHQLDLQWEGPFAFASRTIIADYLKLAPQQIQAIAQLAEDRNLKRKQAPSTPASDVAYAQKLLDILSEQQRTQWAVLLGRPFQFEPDPQPRDPQTARASGETPR